MNISDIMVTEVTSCSPDTSLQDIALLMWNNDCGAIPLVDMDEHPVGIVTDRDIAMGAALQHRPLWDIRGEEVANGRELFCCHPEDNIKEALQLMERHSVRRLPVVNQYAQLCGMVSLGDIASFTQTGRAKKRGDKHIKADETMALLQHISAHHEPRKVASTM